MKNNVRIASLLTAAAVTAASFGTALGASASGISVEDVLTGSNITVENGDGSESSYMYGVDDTTDTVYVASQSPEVYITVEIGSVEEFEAFAENCRYDSWSVDKAVILTADLDFGGEEFEPVVTFGGIFDGQGHTLSGVVLTGYVDETGVFGTITNTGVVRNLNVEGEIAPAGYQSTIGGIAGYNYGTISNCTFSGSITADSEAGGIVGRNGEYGIVISCSSAGSINASSGCGGIAGYNEGTISGCENGMEVNTDYKDTTAGLDELSEAVDVIQQSGSILNTGTLSSNSDNGGIAGFSSGVITSCVNRGTVGYEHVGYNIGGIVGRSSGFLYDNVNYAGVYGRKDVGGIAGQIQPYLTLSFSQETLEELEEALDAFYDSVQSALNDGGYTEEISSHLTNITGLLEIAEDSAADLAAEGADAVDDLEEQLDDAGERLRTALTIFASAGEEFDDYMDGLGSALSGFGDLDLSDYLSELSDSIDGLLEDLIEAFPEGSSYDLSDLNVAEAVQELETLLETLAAVTEENVDLSGVISFSQSVESAVNGAGDTAADLMARIQELQSLLDSLRGQTEDDSAGDGQTEDDVTGDDPEEDDLTEDNSEGDDQEEDNSAGDVQMEENPEGDGQTGEESEGDNLTEEDSEGNGQAEDNPEGDDQTEGDSEGNDQTEGDSDGAGQAEEDSEGDDQTEDGSEGNDQTEDNPEGDDQTEEDSAEAGQTEEDSEEGVQGEMSPEADSGSGSDSDSEGSDGQDSEDAVSDGEESAETDSGATGTDGMNSGGSESDAVDSDAAGTGISGSTDAEEDLILSLTQDSTASDNTGTEGSNEALTAEEIQTYIEKLQNYQSAYTRLTNLSAELQAAAESAQTENLEAWLDGSNVESIVNGVSDAVDSIRSSLSEMGEIVDSYSFPSPDLSDLSDSIDAAAAAIADTEDLTGSLSSALTVLASIDLQLDGVSDTARNSANNLYEAISQMTGEVEELNQSISGAVDSAKGTLSTVVSRFEDVTSALLDAAEAVLSGEEGEETVQDISEKDVENTFQGRATRCVNYGDVNADVNVGGIVGMMGVEYSLDPELDIESSGSATLNYIFRTSCIVDTCVNRGTVTAKTGYSGGISGRMELGLVSDCSSYGTLDGNDGKYTGGIVGYSAGTVRDCAVNCDIAGGTYVGGIAGYGTALRGNVAMVTVTQSVQYVGAIAGRVSNIDVSLISGNYYYSDSVYGIDGGSYQGIAEGISYEKLMAMEDLPEDFGSLTLTFVADTGDGEEIIAVITCEYGDGIAQEELPEIPEREGFYGEWSRTDYSCITVNETIPAEYTRYVTLLTSEQIRESGIPAIEADGQFRAEDVLLVTAETADTEAGEIERWTVSIPDDGAAVHQIRYLAPEEVSGASSLQIQKISADGTRTTVQTDSFSDYMIFEAGGNEVTFAVVKTQTGSSTLILLVIAAAGAAVLVLTVWYLVARSRRRQSRGASEGSI